MDNLKILETDVEWQSASHTLIVGESCYRLAFSQVQGSFSRRDMSGHCANQDDDEGSVQHHHSKATIVHLYDDYAYDIQKHMRYEEKTLFPYVEALLRGEQTSKYNVETFSKHHGDITGKFQELKGIIIKYLPHDSLSNNKLTTTLYDIYINEEWLANHSNIEDQLFVPAIRLLEKKIKNDGISSRLSDIIKSVEGKDGVSEREKDIIVCLVQGMSNKEIADHLFISVNTVITHRRNIAKKLDIRSVAGLTIYAIANNLIDQSFLSKT